MASGYIKSKGAKAALGKMSNYKDCARCKGTGEISRQLGGGGQDKQKCHSCMGRGIVSK